MSINPFYTIIKLPEIEEVIISVKPKRKKILNRNTDLSEKELYIHFINKTGMVYIKNLYIKIIDCVNNNHIPTTLDGCNLTTTNVGIYVSNDMESIPGFFVNYNKKYGWINISCFDRKTHNRGQWRIPTICLYLDVDNNWCLGNTVVPIVTE